MAVYHKVPSQAATGADTFADSLVGVQITDGTSQLTNTNFELDKVIPQKDNKNFRTATFSNFFNLDDLNQAANAPTTTSGSTGTTRRSDEVRFNGNKKYADVSLFGSLSSRILVSLKNIITTYPAAIQVKSITPIGTTNLSAFNVVYDINLNKTTFNIESSKIFNPFGIVIKQPNSLVQPTTDNQIRNFYSSYLKYVIDVENVSYPILNYLQTDSNGYIQLTVYGNPFNNQSYSSNFLIRPNDGLVEEFYSGLDDLQSSLLNRETSPVFTATFKVPRDSTDNSKTVLADESFSWPLSDDGWNLKITGLEYETYVSNLSDISTEIDDYKSNLVVRFLAAPQLFEFDTDDTRAQDVFQLYGQSFDSVKKYIDNIAYMRNVSYDGVNNLPDVLLKNLAENLGYTTTNLFDDKNFDDIFYTRIPSNYDGVSMGYNMVDAEYEFYRRLLVNLAYIYKSKGTRQSIEFFLKFLGAPEPLIKIDEYVYQITDIPSSANLQQDIYDVIMGLKTYGHATFDPTTFSYTQVNYTGTTTYNRAGYPVDETTGLPRRASNKVDDVFFQKGSGWYDETLSHRAPLVPDTQNSVYTGRTKVLLTTNKPYSYGEDYFNQYKTLPGLDTGYKIKSSIDNVKAHSVGDNSSLLMNRKNINIHISPSLSIDYDIYAKSRELQISFGSHTLPSQTGVTFAEYLDGFIHGLITNSNVIRYKKNYISLEDVYRDYLNKGLFSPYNFIDSNEFINKISPYWMQLVEQLLPSTTLWTGGNVTENNSFGRPKYQYIYDCQPLEFIDNLYPDFENAIEEDLETILGEDINFRTLLEVSGVTYTPVIEIDGTEYLGTPIIVSGTTSIPGVSAKLFDFPSFPMTGCTDLPSGDTTNLPLICNYKDYLTPDISAIETLWETSLTSLITGITITRYTAGYELYQPYLDYTSGTTHTTETLPVLNYEFFTDVDGVKKIKFSSIKYGIGDCSIKNYFEYRFSSEYNVSKNNDRISVVVSGGTTFSSPPTGCTVSPIDVNIVVTGLTKTGIQKLSSSVSQPWSFYISAFCQNTFNENLSGATIPASFTQVSGCDYTLHNVGQNDIINVNLIDAANKEIKFTIEGLETKVDWDPLGKSHVETIEIKAYQGMSIISDKYDSFYCDQYTGYTVVPKISYETEFNYGIKYDSTVLWCNPSLTIDNTTTSNDIKNYISNGSIIRKQVKDIVLGDYLLSAIYLPCNGYSSQQVLDGPISGYSFSYNYVTIEVQNIECLSSLKVDSITGVTSTGGTRVFQVLPTSQLRVYTNKYVENYGVPQNTTYFFDDRYPEELQIRDPNYVEPCCDHNYNTHGTGDYLINQYGELIEVIAVDLDYCDPQIFFNIDFSIDAYEYDQTYLIIFNGNNTDNILLEHKYSSHLDNFKLGQYYIDPINCPTIPTDSDLEKSVFPGC